MTTIRQSSRMIRADCRQLFLQGVTEGFARQISEAVSEQKTWAVSLILNVLSLQMEMKRVSFVALAVVTWLQCGLLAVLVLIPISLAERESPLPLLNVAILFPLVPSAGAIFQRGVARYQFARFAGRNIWYEFSDSGLEPSRISTDRFEK
jgi:hypothetical protein